MFCAPTTVRSALLAALAAAALSAPASAVIVFNDGVFNPPDWSLTTITNAAGVGSTVSPFQQLTGGNPNQFRRIRHNLVVGTAGNGAVVGVHLNALSFYNPSSGAIASINYSEDSINFINQGGNGQGSGLAIFQSGRYYIQRTPILIMPYAGFSTWTANAAPGLIASNLWEIDLAGNLFPGNNPDFSVSGGVMQFGFWRGNSANQNIQTDCGIDNWHVEITQTPAPGAAALAGMGGLIALRRRRAR